LGCIFASSQTPHDKASEEKIVKFMLITGNEFAYGRDSNHLILDQKPNPFAAKICMGNESFQNLEHLCIV
jgi:hypothetical protein